MSRNTEKAQSALNRFQLAKSRSAGVLESNPQLRPKYVQLVKNLPQAEKWRSVVIGEISTNLTRIQDPNINHVQIRDINEHLNKLFREKRAWEHHIKLLGGADYTLLSGGDAGIKVKGYRYYGRARELPDVQEMLKQTEEAEKKKKSRTSEKQEAEVRLQIRRERLGPFYYGCYDGDSSPVPTKKDVDKELGYTNEEGKYKRDSRLLAYEEERSRELGKQFEDQKFEGHFEDLVPTSEQVSRWIVEERKRKLMERLNSGAQPLDNAT